MWMKRHYLSIDLGLTRNHSRVWALLRLILMNHLRPMRYLLEANWCTQRFFLRHVAFWKIVVIL